MPKTVILGSARTPIGKMGGGLSTLDATELGGLAIEAALERAGVEPEQVEHVVMGQVLQAGQGQIPSRQAQIKAGIPKEVSSETINKVCASGLRASVIIDQAIRAGDMSVGVGGGMESMSKAPYLLPQARFGYRMGDAKMLDAMVHDGLTDPFSGKQMFVEATEVGDELEMTRADLDRWALRSHELALKAIDEGRMSEEIVSVTITGRKGDTVVDIDEGPRRDTSLEAARRAARPVGKEGSHTAGNSPGVNDGGGALVLSSDEWAQANGKEALAEIVAHAQSANDFAYLARTPARPRRRRSRRPVCSPATSTCGRSTRRSRRSRSTPSACSASTRTASTSTAARSRSGTRSAPPAPASSARSSTSCAGAAAARLRRDLLRRRAGRRLILKV